MEEGADALYTGSLAETLSAEIILAGGIITPQDLAAYEPTVRYIYIYVYVAGDSNTFTFILRYIYICSRRLEYFHVYLY